MWKNEEFRPIFDYTFNLLSSSRLVLLYPLIKDLYIQKQQAGPMRR